MKITIERSANWVAAERLSRGVNVPAEVTVEVKPADLSIEARKVLLDAGHGAYAGRFDGYFDGQYKFCESYSYSRCSVRVDGDAPFAPDAVSAAIVDAAARLEAKRQEWLAAKQAREEAAARQAAEKEAAARKLAEARELLRAELDLMESYREDRKILGEFLASIPEDALRGAVKAKAHSPEAVEALIEQIEEASPVYIFDRD